MAINEIAIINNSATGQIVVYPNVTELVAVAAQGPSGPAGEQGSGGSGGGGDYFLFTQSILSTTWTVNHNFGRIPNVTVLSPGGQVVVAQVTNISNNQVQISFTNPYSGQVICE